jgi:hypothetical protein
VLFEMLQEKQASATEWRSFLNVAVTTCQLWRHFSLYWLSVVEMAWCLLCGQEPGLAKITCHWRDHMLNGCRVTRRLLWPEHPASLEIYLCTRCTGYRCWSCRGVNCGCWSGYDSHRCYQCKAILCTNCMDDEEDEICFDCGECPSCCTCSSTHSQLTSISASEDEPCLVCRELFNVDDLQEGCSVCNEGPLCVNCSTDCEQCGAGMCYQCRNRYERPRGLCCPSCWEDL